MQRPYLIIHTILLVALCATLPAQSQQKEKPSVPLTDVIQEMEDALGLSFSYEPSLIETFSVPPAKGEYDINYLQTLSNSLPLDFERIEDTYVLIKTRPSKVSVRLIALNSDEPISESYVKLNGNYLNVSSDANGRFDFVLDWSLKDTLTFQSVGFTPIRVSALDVIHGQEKALRMEEEITVLEEFTIKSYLSPGISANQKNHSIEIRNDELGILPGDASKDLMVSLKALPGIHTVTGRAGELRIRGGTPDQNLILFNNIPIYHKGYYFGTISPFSTDFVESIRVYRSGFGPELGSRVGGAVEISSNQTVSPKLNGSVFSNSYFAGASAKAPIIKDRLSFSISARSAHPFGYEAPMEKELKKLALYGDDLFSLSEINGSEFSASNFDFWDLNGSLVFSQPKVGKIRLNALSINNLIEVANIDDVRGASRGRANELSNDGFSGDWTKQFGAITASFYGSQSDYQFDRITTATTPRDASLREETNSNSIANLRLGGKVEGMLKKWGAWTLGYDYS
ncbi:MAG: TonB-dependent receptor plug domain-containing protein, partial [Bacteroidota bacterium]